LQQLITQRMGDDAARLAFHEVDWSDIGQREEDWLLDQQILPDQRHPFDLAHPLDSLLEQADELTRLSTRFRRFLIGSVGDVFTYLTQAGKQAIQERLKQQIFAARDQQIAAGASAPHYVTILAHSLGSVVTYDLARYFGDTPEGRAEVGSAKLANLFTFGSPLALFSLLEYGQQRPGAEIDQDSVLADGQSAQRDAHPYSQRGIRLDLPGGVWWNFFDQQDAIACMLHDLYAPINEIRDIPVQTGALHAHTSYWRNAQMADEIAGQLKRTLTLLSG
jgi:hypothetical protein